MRDFFVNENRWNLVFVRPSDENLQRSDGTYTLGVTDNTVKTVFVSDAIDGDLLTKVITHEVTHIFCFEYDLHFDINTEEILADFVATYGREVIETADRLLFEKFRRTA